MDKECLPSALDLSEMVALICKEETNTFGLYPTATGPLSVVGQRVSRGESYGLSLYPRAAMFNHSCQPSVAHAPDAHGCMVCTAARDIGKGEELTITYFDLAARKTVASRQEHVREQFRFKCTCDRCVEDEAAENLAELDALPLDGGAW